MLFIIYTFQHIIVALIYILLLLAIPHTTRYQTRKIRPSIIFLLWSLLSGFFLTGAAVTLAYCWVIWFLQRMHGSMQNYCRTKHDKQDVSSRFVRYLLTSNIIYSYYWLMIEPVFDEEVVALMYEAGSFTRKELGADNDFTESTLIPSTVPFRRKLTFGIDWW